MTAKDLLYQILDYDHAWSLPEYKNSVSVKLRLVRIHALQHAFGISKNNADPTLNILYNGVDRATYLQGISDLDYLMKGEFLHDRPFASNQLLLERLRAKLPEALQEFPVRNRDLYSLYLNLISYRKRVFAFTAPASGHQEGFSPGMFYSKRLQGDLNDIIEANLQEIDQVLCLIFDPGQRDVPLQELISAFGYDDTNLYDHDQNLLNDY